MSFKKNTSGQFIYFQGVDVATGGIKSGVSWTVRRSLDGTFAAGTGTVTEDGSTGWYRYAMSQADTNGNNIGFNFTGSGAVPQTVNIITDGNAPDVNVTKVGGTNQTARDLGASVLLSPGTGTGQVSLSSGQVTVSSNNDKTGYGLSAAAVQAIWDALTSALTTANSIGKRLADNIDAAISSRSTYAGGAVASVTGNVGGNVTGSVGSLAAQAKADVNAEVVDALNVDTYAEPGQEAPGATISLAAKIGYLYKAFRNRKTQTATTMSLFADDGTTVDQKATVSDDGSTFDHGEIASGP